MPQYYPEFNDPSFNRAVVTKANISTIISNRTIP